MTAVLDLNPENAEELACGAALSDDAVDTRFAAVSALRHIPGQGDPLQGSVAQEGAGNGSRHGDNGSRRDRMRHRLAARIFRALRFASLCVLVLCGCRTLAVCDPPVAGCEGPAPSGAAGAGGVGGAGGAAGATGQAASSGEGGDETSGGGGSLACIPPRADCDDSNLNGCEASTATNPLHCGACKTVCSGACGEGRCHAFELVTKHSMILNGGFAIAADAAYFLVRVGEDRAALLRTFESGRVETILDNLSGESSDFGPLSLGVDRVYFSQFGNVRSVPFSGGGVVEEGIAADYVVVAGDWLYWDGYESLHRRNLSSGLVEQIDMPGLGGLMAHLGSVIVLAEGSDGEQLQVVDWPDTQLIAALPGSVIQVAGDDDALWWLVLEGDDDTGSTALYTAEVRPELREPRLVTREAEFTSFTVGLGLVYASFERPGFPGLRVVSREQPERLEAGTRKPLEMLAVGFDYLWVAEDFSGTLFRVRVQEVFQ